MDTHRKQSIVSLHVTLFGNYNYFKILEQFLKFTGKHASGAH